jgi:hypothetical protein
MEPDFSSTTFMVAPHNIQERKGKVLMDTGKLITLWSSNYRIGLWFLQQVYISFHVDSQGNSERVIVCPIFTHESRNAKRKKNRKWNRSGCLCK